MQNYYNELYKKIEIKEQNNLCNVYMFIDYRSKAKEFEFEQYKAQYGHIVHRYEMLRRTKIWKLAKKVKNRLRKK